MVSLPQQYPPGYIADTPQAVRYVPPTADQAVVQRPHQVQQPPEIGFTAPVTLLAEQPIVVSAGEVPTTKTAEDIRGIMKLLGITDISKVPSIQEVMDMLGASTQEEAIDTVKDIAATEEGIDLIKSFIESRQTPDDEEFDETVIEVITQPQVTTTTTPAPTTTTSTTTTTTTPPPIVPVTTVPEKPFHFWDAPKKLFSSASARVATKLDNAHTEAHLLGKITSEHHPESEQSSFRNTLRNLRNFFSFTDNTPIPLDSFRAPEKPALPRYNTPITNRRPAAPSSVVYVNEPIPATPMNLPQLPSLAPLPELSAVQSIPVVPQMPRIQLPSHFSIPKRIVQGPYMKVKYPVASLAPLPMYRQRSLASGGASHSPVVINKSSYDVPLYGPQITNGHQIPYSQSTRDAFQKAPQIVTSSLPVPSLPYTFTSQATQQVDVDEPYAVAANSPVESVVVAVLPEGKIEQVLRSSDADAVNELLEEEKAEHDAVEQIIAKASGARGRSVGGVGPQRLSGYESYATGKVHRATGVDLVQSQLTTGSRSNGAGVYTRAAAEEVENSSSNGRSGRQESLSSDTTMTVAVADEGVAGGGNDDETVPPEEATSSE